MMLFIPPEKVKAVGGEDWWDANWDYRMNLTLDNSGQSEYLENFPVLINLSSSNFDYSHAKNDGTDLRFIDGDGITELKYHIEDWDESGYSYVWVNCTNITASSYDYIWMYYGNTGASDVQDEEGTYDINYTMVQHMDDTTTSTITDSTIYDNDGTKTGANEPIENDSKIYKGQNFDANDDVINCGTDTSLTMNVITVEFWAKFTHHDVRQYFISKGAWNGISAINIAFEATVMRVYYGDGASYFYFTVAMSDYANWHYYVVRLNATNRAVWRDGVNVANSASTGLNSGTSNLYLGSYQPGGVAQYTVDGDIDEVRISNIARSADWIKAQWLSMTNAFVTYNSEQSYYDNSVDADSNIDSVDNIGSANSTFINAKELNGTYQNITENLTSDYYEDIVDNNASDVDSSPDKGYHYDFERMKANDSSMDTLTENYTGVTGVDETDYVDAFVDVWNEWVTTGTEPWIDEGLSDGNYITCDKGLEEQGWFTFGDTSETGSGFTITIYMYFIGGDGNDDMYWEVDTTGDNTAEFTGTILNPTDGWHDTGAITGFDTATEYNAGRLYLQGIASGGYIDPDIDACYIRIERTGGDNYECDIEVQFTGITDLDNTNEYLCIYAGTQDAEALKVDVYHSSTWNNVISDLTANNWNNVSIGSYLDSATLTIRFLGGTETSDTSESTWDIDIVMIKTWDATNHELQWEHQCWDVPDGSYTYTLAIYGSTSDAENMEIQVWGGASWGSSESTVISTTEQWYNNTLDAGDVIDDNVTWRYIGATETGDSTQSTLSIDFAGVYYDPIPPYVNFVIKADGNVTRDGVWGSEPFRYGNLNPATNDILSTDWFYGSGNTTYIFNFTQTWGDLAGQTKYWQNEGGNTSIETIDVSNGAWRIYVYYTENINDKVTGYESGNASDAQGNITIDGLQPNADYWFKIELDIGESVLQDDTTDYRGDITRYAEGV